MRLTLFISWTGQHSGHIWCMRQYERRSGESRVSDVARCDAVDGRHVSLQLSDQCTAGRVPHSQDTSSTHTQQHGRRTVSDAGHAAHPVTVSTWYRLTTVRHQHHRHHHHQYYYYSESTNGCWRHTSSETPNALWHLLRALFRNHLNYCHHHQHYHHRHHRHCGQSTLLQNWTAELLSVFSRISYQGAGCTQEQGECPIPTATYTVTWYRLVQ